jgi:DNA-binding NarL/FixJ family response regulator
MRPPRDVLANSESMIRVLVLEPDPWRYRGISGALHDSGTIQVVGEPDYGKILTLTAPPDSAKVDVILLAHRLVVEYGLAVVPVLRELFKPCAVLVYGDLDSLEVAAQLLAVGARGYHILSEPPGFLVKAVSVCSTGKLWGPREAVALMAERLVAAIEVEAVAEPSRTLGADEQKLLDLLNDGLVNKEIAQRLGVAEATVKSRLSCLYKQFAVKTRLQLLSTAMHEGLVGARH